MLSMLEMKRVISDDDEQLVYELFNRTADELSIPRPLNSDGWYQVKAYLREQASSEWVHSMACSNLEIDPPKSRKGIAAAICPILEWLLSPSDRHGAISDLSRALVWIAIFSCVGLLIANIAAYFGYVSNAQFFVVIFASVFILSIFSGVIISTETHWGIMAIVLISLGVYMLMNEPFEWMKTVSAIGVIFFSCFWLKMWLRK